jgi:hypothetical protein
MTAAALPRRTIRSCAGMTRSPLPNTGSGSVHLPGHDANQRPQVIKYLLIHGAMIWSQRAQRDMVLA